MHLESFDFVSTSVKSKTKRSDLQEKLPELAEAAPADEMTKPGFKNKASQTQKIRQKRVQCTSVLDTLDADMERRRKMAVEEDRIRLKRLMEAINSDPPPSWHVASLMWLDVDALEKRIEAYEKEEEEKKNEAKKKKKKDD
ncbi:hypothetical protein AWZ03_009748 [Drosophila navojoa]|uniref:Uncharacterized protein n=1 Tax=Drosophila navojoa TaxID=7232 RepID=A0A484B4M9_DRONA|nr:hypothetical protein AWZ03_009748 [Drosophila navojoa]